MAALTVIAVAVTVTVLLLRDHRAEANQDVFGTFPVIINTWGFDKASADGKCVWRLMLLLNQ